MMGAMSGFFDKIDPQSQQWVPWAGAHGTVPLGFGGSRMNVRRLFSFPNPVNEVSARLVAGVDAFINAPQ